MTEESKMSEPKKFNMRNIVEKGQKTKVLLVVSNGIIRRECVQSLCTLTRESRNNYIVEIYMCGENEYEMDVLEKFSEHGSADVIIFTRSYVGFTTHAIDTIVEKTLATKCIVGIPVPRADLSLDRIKITQEPEDARILACCFDIQSKTKQINVDEHGMMDVRGFQRNDIVGFSLSLSRNREKPLNISRGFSNMNEDICVLCTKYPVSNSGTSGCLLQHLQCIQKHRQNVTNLNS